MSQSRPWQLRKVFSNIKRDRWSFWTYDKRLTWSQSRQWNLQSSRLILDPRCPAFLVCFHQTRGSACSADPRIRIFSRSTDPHDTGAKVRNVPVYKILMIVILLEELTGFRKIVYMPNCQCICAERDIAVSQRLWNAWKPVCVKGRWQNDLYLLCIRVGISGSHCCHQSSVGILASGAVSQI